MIPYTFFIFNPLTSHTRLYIRILIQATTAIGSLFLLLHDIKNTWISLYLSFFFFFTRSLLFFRQRHSSSNVIWWNFHIVWRKMSFASISRHEITSIPRHSFPEGYCWCNSYIIFKQYFRTLTRWFVNVTIGWTKTKFN